MDYIKQLNAFDNWLEYNDLDITAQVMWYKLMSIANKSGWQKELSIANTKLMAKLEIDKKAVINCRNRLIQAGLIEYKSRGTKKAGIYKIRVLYSDKKETNDYTNKSISPLISSPRETNQRTNQGTNGYPNTEPMTVPYINKTKQKNNISPTTPKMAESAELESDFEKLWKLYPRKERKANALKAYKKAIKAGTTNKEIQTGIIAYKNSVVGKDPTYIAQGGTWFTQQRWKDELTTDTVRSLTTQYNLDEVDKAYEQ